MRSCLTVLFSVFFAAAGFGQSFDFRETAPGVKMRFIGPGSGGAMFGMAIHPEKPDIMIFGGDMGACFRTEDGGKTWDILGGESGDCPCETWNVAFHLRCPNVVWHLGSGVLKSIDSGKTWKNIHAPAGTYCALGLDPDNPDVVYAAEGQSPRMVLSWTRGRVIKSTDGGKSWKQLSLPYTALFQRGVKHPNFTDFIIDSSSPVIKGEGHGRVFLFGRAGLFRSDDAGKSWKDLSKSFAPGQINDMALIAGRGKSTLLLSVAPAAGLKRGGIYKSVDRGKSWQPANQGLDGLIKRLKVRNKRLKEDPNCSLFTLMLAHRDNTSERRVYAGSWQGIYCSHNGGDSWFELAPAEGAAYVKDKDGLSLPVPKKKSVFKRSIWGGIDHFNRFIVDLGNPDIVAFSDNQDMYLSKNGGKTWSSLSFDYGEPFDPSLYPGTAPNRFAYKTISRGPQNIVCRHMEIDPFDPRIYYCAYMDLGLEISRDGGRSWEHPTRGLPGRGHTWFVAADPGKKGRLYLTMNGTRNQKGGLYLSEDWGRKWERIGLNQAGTGKLQALAIDLNSPVEKRVLYLGSGKKGIYKSIDGGEAWENFTLGSSPAANSILCLALSPGSSTTIYAGTKAGLFVSHDSGRVWTRLGKGEFEKVESISICRKKPSTFYVCAHYPGRNHYWGKAGFWRTDDGGKGFSNVTPAYFKYAGAIAVNPFDPNYVYGCNFLFDPLRKDQKMKIVRSRNGGKTWEVISRDLACNRSRRILIYAANPSMFFVLTRFGIIEGRDGQAPLR